MKKIIVVVMLLFACLSSEAQKFLRYQMNNNTYNGFYTNGIGSILHDYKNGIATTFVHASGKVYEIPINDIDSISVEDVNVANGNLGQYRIYEFNYEEGDIKKIYVDNRASLFASHNGDFGANDTILFSSAYNDIAWVFYTDNQGRIKKFSDGNRFLYFDYESDSEFTILDLSTNNTEHYQLSTENGVRVYRAPSFSQISTFFSNLVNNAGFRDFMGGVGLNAANNIAGNFARNIKDVGNNPELHNQSFIVDGLSIAGDIVGIVASLLTEAPSLGWSTAGVAASAGFLLNDLTGLINHIWPDSEQMQRYKDYYQNKYSIHVAAIAAENVSNTSATLRGEATSLEGLNGTFTFRLYGDNDETLSGIKNNITSNSCIITANASNLKPGWPYFYSVQYTCVVDGLQLVFYADNIAEFMTLSPTAYTGEVQSKSSDRAEVTCQFYNFPEGAICGVEYSCNDGKAEERANATHEGEYYFTLAPLKPNTTYTYQAFVVIDGVYVYAEETKQFTTDKGGLCPDNNHPHMIDLGLPSGTKWACCNIGASSPEEFGNYYAWGETCSRGGYSGNIFIGFTEENYQFYNGETASGVGSFIVSPYTDIGSNISGTVYDAAKTNWGGSWRMPTKLQFEELIRYTTSTWATVNGINGRKFVGTKGAIFLPAAGGGIEGAYTIYGTGGNYWSSTIVEGRLFNAWYLSFGSGGSTMNYDGHRTRYYGHSVRPIL